MIKVAYIPDAIASRLADIERLKLEIELLQEIQQNLSDPNSDQRAIRQDLRSLRVDFEED